jgi:beta-barrel assembly-enhancing protease
MGFLKFSRDAEREADLLGLEYDYAAGYDPQEFVRLFERLEAGEKENKNFVAKAFTTHPMTTERIKRAEKEIEDYFPPRENYTVDTSEFQQVRSRLAQLSNRRQIDLGRITPVLRRRGPEQQTQEGGDDSGRPTLHRRD